MMHLFNFIMYVIIRWVPSGSSVRILPALETCSILLENYQIMIASIQ